MSIGPFGVKSVYSVFKKIQGDGSGGRDKNEVDGSCGTPKNGC